MKDKFYTYIFILTTGMALSAPLEASYYLRACTSLLTRVYSKISSLRLKTPLLTQATQLLRHSSRFTANSPSATASQALCIQKITTSQQSPKFLIGGISLMTALATQAMADFERVVPGYNYFGPIPNYLIIKLANPDDTFMSPIVLPPNSGWKIVEQSGQMIKLQFLGIPNGRHIHLDYTYDPVIHKPIIRIENQSAAWEGQRIKFSDEGQVLVLQSTHGSSFVVEQDLAGKKLYGDALDFRGNIKGMFYMNLKGAK